MARRNNPLLAIPLSFLAAILLTVLPLPHSLAYWRPDWVAMILLFWVLNEPGLVGVWTAFFLGLLIDVLTGTLFGMHPFMLALVAYLARLSHRWVGVFSVWQTAGLALALVGAARLLQFVVMSAQGAAPDSLLYCVPAFSSALVWPTVTLALRRWSTAIR
jgi:rod shape-determining protein MreD